MILTIPIIYLENGKSKYSISGLPSFEKIESHFKNNPIELAKLFREENNKSLLFNIDKSNESLEVGAQVKDLLDIPIQVISYSNYSDYLNDIFQIPVNRIFIPINNMNLLSNSVPIISLSELSKFDLSKYSRVMIDFERNRLREVKTIGKTKISIINSECNTSDLVEINKIDTSIDSIYLGKEYYGVHFAGQILWRIAEKAQFAI